MLCFMVHGTLFSLLSYQVFYLKHSEYVSVFCPVQTNIIICLWKDSRKIYCELIREWEIREVGVGDRTG